MRLSSNIADQLRATYSRLATTFGEVMPEEELAQSVADFWAQEDSHHYRLGCPDYRDRPALVFGVTALVALCATNRRTAVRLLEMALAEIKTNHPDPTDFAERFDL
ncbi:hypothetical protein A5719_10340 [Mycolicibacterium peregrinum]|uniref:hypothetical protein n=1 Tax=Mycolicibacterium peregrinum TaxID=43304 RepID=UPI0007EB0A7B|nr:hypothetical protein [Mycolicibacterium peregrinum]OBF42833.1 hypothetical protein A5719_10340 [Mycolicibacterium peregrinum]